MKVFQKLWTPKLNHISKNNINKNNLRKIFCKVLKRNNKNKTTIVSPRKIAMLNEKNDFNKTILNYKNRKVD
jgi:hypothetical protein